MSDTEDVVKIAKRLIKIADYLDSQGKEEDADFLDSLIKSDIDYDEIIDIPEEEMELLKQISEALQEGLAQPEEVGPVIEPLAEEVPTEISEEPT